MDRIGQCRVPEKCSEDISLQHIFLPFDDDEMLSLILNKILLLSNDQIQDNLFSSTFKSHK